jgi:hypothetical protein
LKAETFENGGVFGITVDGRKQFLIKNVDIIMRGEYVNRLLYWMIPAIDEIAVKLQ